MSNTTNAVSKELMSKVSDDVRVALEEVAKMHNIELNPRLQITYSNDWFKIKDITFITIDKDAFEKKQFEEHCRHYNVPKEKYLAQFNFKGVVWELIGFEPKRPKYSYKCRNIADKEVALFTDDILRKLGIENESQIPTLVEVPPPPLR